MNRISLPNEIIREIALNISDEFDFVHFLKTCRQFRAACAGISRKHPSWVAFRKYYKDLQKLMMQDSGGNLIGSYINQIIENRGYSVRFLRENTEKLYALFASRRKSAIFYKLTAEIAKREQEPHYLTKVGEKLKDPGPFNRSRLVHHESKDNCEVYTIDKEYLLHCKPRELEKNMTEILTPDEISEILGFDDWTLFDDDSKETEIRKGIEIKYDAPTLASNRRITLKWISKRVNRKHANTLVALLSNDFNKPH